MNNEHRVLTRDCCCLASSQLQINIGLTSYDKKMKEPETKVNNLSDHYGCICHLVFSSWLRKAATLQASCVNLMTLVLIYSTELVVIHKI